MSFQQGTHKPPNCVSEISIAMLRIDLRGLLDVWKCSLHTVAWMDCKKSLLVNVCTCSFLSCFPIVSFVSWDRRRKSCEEQQALSSFWSSEQKTVSQNLQEGKMMTWWSDVNLKNPRKNPVYVLIVLFFFLATLETTGFSLSSGAFTSCCVYTLYW